MQNWMVFVAIALLMVPGSTMSQSNDALYAEELYDKEQYDAFIEKVKAALGVFHDIKVFERDAEGDSWQLVSGRYIPVTVDDKEPDSYHADMRSDHPMMLPTRVEGFQGGDGQSSPYSVVGRMPGSNPEVQWVFLVRQYSIKKPTDDNFAKSGDMAVIGHHPRTGASVYFQFYQPQHPKRSEVVVSPFSDDGMKFWAPLDTIAKEYLCQRCHNADPFLHTPWINQVRVREPSDDDPFPEPMVPSNPLGPFFFIDSEWGGLFHHWNDSLRHLNDPDNACTQCHRVTPFDLTGLYQNSTGYAGLDRPEYNEFSIEAHGYQTDKYRDLPWMPPVSPDNFEFYAGQEDVQLDWHEQYEKSASEVNKLTPQDSEKLAPVPRPPKEYRAVVVDRPEQDRIEPGRSVWIVDTRMRANTDGDLHQWRFFGKGSPSSNMQAAPVVYRRAPTASGTKTFELAFVGEPRRLESAETWVPVMEGQTYELKQGDYLGLVLRNNGNESGSAIIPYTEDDWARLTWPNGTPRYHDGSVIYQVTLDRTLEVGEEITFKDTDYRTYSFEMKNKL